MGTFRQLDPFLAFLICEQARVLEHVNSLASGTGASRAHATAEAKRILTALADAEAAVLVPAFSRVRLRPETQALLDDSRGERAEQLAALEQLARKRAVTGKKLAALQLGELVKSYSEQLVTLLVPVLASQMPRAMYRAMAQAFMTRYAGEEPHGVTLPRVDEPAPVFAKA